MAPELCPAVAIGAQASAVLHTKESLRRVHGQHPYDSAEDQLIRWLPYKHQVDAFNKQPRKIDNVALTMVKTQAN